MEAALKFWQSCNAKPKPFSISNFQLDLIKLLAFISMIIDHVNEALFANKYEILTNLGRFAFPFFVVAFAYSVVNHSKNPAGANKKLFWYGLAAQIPFTVIFWETSKHVFCFNILFLFLLAVWVRKIWSLGGYYPSIAIALGIVLGAQFWPASYGWPGLCMILFAIGFFRSGGLVYLSGFLVTLQQCVWAWPWMIPVILAALFIILKFCNASGRFLPKQFLYIGYPLHLWLLTIAKLSI